MGEIETAGPEAPSSSSACSPTTSRRSRWAAPSTPCLCRDDGGVLDDLFTYRLADDRYLTVTNAANHEQDLAWFAGARGEFDAEVRDRDRRLRDARRPGPEARGIVGRLADGELPLACRTAELAIAGAPPSSAGPATRARTASSC